jgi:hypothetical protein
LTKEILFRFLKNSPIIWAAIWYFIHEYNASLSIEPKA